MKPKIIQGKDELVSWARFAYNNRTLANDDEIEGCLYNEALMNANRMYEDVIEKEGYTTVSRFTCHTRKRGASCPSLPVQLSPAPAFSDGDGTGELFGAMFFREFMCGIAFLVFMVAVFALMKIVEVGIG